MDKIVEYLAKAWRHTKNIVSRAMNITVRGSSIVVTTTADILATVAASILVVIFAVGLLLMAGASSLANWTRAGPSGLHDKTIDAEFMVEDG